MILGKRPRHLKTWTTSSLGVGQVHNMSCHLPLAWGTDLDDFAPQADTAKSLAQRTGVCFFLFAVDQLDPHLFCLISWGVGTAGKSRRAVLCPASSTETAFLCDWVPSGDAIDAGRRAPTICRLKAGWGKVCPREELVCRLARCERRSQGAVVFGWKNIKWFCPPGYKFIFSSFYLVHFLVR